MFPQLKFYYSAYGKKAKERYRLNSASVTFIEQ